MSDSSSEFSFKKPRFRGGNRSRGRVCSDEEKEDVDEANSSVVKKEKRSLGGLLVSRSGGRKGKKRSRRSKDRSDSSSSSSSDEDSAQKKHSIVSVSFKGTGEEQTSTNDATRYLETETSVDQDHRSIYERSRQINSELKNDSEVNPLEDNTYRGLNNYHKFIEKRDSAAGSAGKMSASGPKRAPTHIRSTVRWDYAPDICKDYKETGFCGFGDSCKFMHDRSDYKFGWQLEKDMANGNYEEEDDRKYEISSEDEDFPFKCFYCKDSFVAPVVTKCKHYFCEKCALSHYRKSQRCFACGKQTNGVFNPAKELMAKLESLKDNPQSEDEDAVLLQDEEEEKKVEKYKSDGDESSEEETDIPGDKNDDIENADIDDNLQPDSEVFVPVEIQNEVIDE